MGIYITGMEMPTKENAVILITPSGDVWMIGDMPNEDTHLVKAKAIPVSSHGDLIDANKLVELCDIMADKCDSLGVSVWHQFRTTVEWSPIVIPAEED